MKNLFYSLAMFCLFVSCKETKKEIKLTNAQKIANAHGFEHWKNVTEVEFNFSGKRHWKWNPKTNDIIYTKDTISISYNRATVDSTTIQIDRAFVNDKFWLLIPFQLIWDEGLTLSKPIIAKAPISNRDLNKITMTYSNTGGYTPGDAYDLFYNDNYIIEEWIFRRGNSTEPTLINTFENYQDFNGIKIALDHKNPQSDWSLNFKDVKISVHK
ncbi:hypothetical protein [Aestuariivivens insulae]|uniref:hypothetical protein n=1 Tax=Aestuariivivens insulae TaxID=1621988 RepID=UPI001F57520D|nr:hypothetical protein [Aestuariivivens insulae]